MKKRIVFFVVLVTLSFTLAGTSQAWQGRMAGMGDPYGLVSDESDFLIHPAKIAQGEGVRFFGDYRFTYTGVTDWYYSLDAFVIGANPVGFQAYDTSGDEQRHDTLVGIAFPAGSGRMGLFFEYASMTGDYDGDGYRPPFTDPITYDLGSDLDAFTVSLLYGLPVGSFTLGGELQLAYRQEENETFLQWFLPWGTFSLLNNYQGTFDFVLGTPFSFNLFPFMRPYDSSYKEALIKGSLAGAIGPVKTAFTLRGGFIFGGDNQLQYIMRSPMSDSAFDLDGPVEGWQIGGDLWLRYPLGDNLSLPFLVRVGYHAKSRDGDGRGSLGYSGYYFDYEHEETSLDLEVGGGLDVKLAGGSRVAVGIYYRYLDTADSFSIARQDGWTVDHSAMPDYSEHRLRLSLAGEREISPVVALRMGMDLFCGWVREDYEHDHDAIIIDDVSLDGSHWGIGASFGAAVKFQRLTLEPFVNVGYEGYDLDGDGGTVSPLSSLLFGSDLEKTMREWVVSSGVSLTWGSQGQGVEQTSEDVVELGVGEQFVTSHKCPKCGRTFPAEYKFCPYDTTELETVRVKK